MYLYQTLFVLIRILKAYIEPPLDNYIFINALAGAAANFPNGEAGRQLRLRGYTPFMA